MREMTKVWCHRGYSGRYPENTMLAFQKAVETGAEGIELDVQLTRDGEVIVLHDETLDRTTDGTGPVAQVDLKTLQTYNAGKKFPEFGFQTVPTFREYLEFAKKTGIFTDIELKTGVNPYPGMEEKVWNMIREFGLEDKVMFSSFRYESLINMRRLAPEVDCGYLSEDWTADLPEHIRGLGLQASHPFYLDLTKSRCRRLTAAGLPINTYTPNGERDLRRLMAWGVNAVITNEPELALKIREEMEKNPANSPVPR